MKTLFINDRRRLINFCERNDINYIGVFGSFSRGEEKPNSDIDILVDFNQKKSLMEIGGIQYDLQKRLGRTVDLVSKKNVKPDIKKNILKDLKVLYEKK
jgi:uncharacterized protein